DLKATLSGLMFDKSGITEELLDLRMDILHDGVYGPYFSKLFDGNKQRYIDQTTLSDVELSRISCPLLMIHGRDDVMFPDEPLTVALAPKIAHADVL
ncbi:hypothetical protein ACPTFP_30395, partial [Pseudomonas aeruginosa]|uniref:hypothetical protein n=1 Tax=Pseudomonas aeruginosa TaxID=287 RepID=UPI003CC57D80